MRIQDMLLPNNVLKKCFPCALHLRVSKFILYSVKTSHRTFLDKHPTPHVRVLFPQSRRVIKQTLALRRTWW